MDRNLIFHHIMTKIFLKKKNFKNFSAISWKWTTECFKIDCGHNLLIEISFKKYRTIKQICTILKCQYVTKATFSYLPTINVTFLIFHHFPVESPRCVFLLCLPVVFPVVLPRCASPLCSPSGFWTRRAFSWTAMFGTCAIYVPKRQLDVEEKLWQTSAEDCTK